MKALHRLVIVFEVQALLLLWPPHVLAHPMQGVSDFYAGMLHPLTAIECILPIVALSLIAGQQARRVAIAILVSFPFAIALGALLGLAVPASRPLAIINTAAMAVLGILVAINRKLPLLLSVALSVILGVSIGWVNGGELTPDVSPYRFIPDLALVCLLLACYGIGAVRRLRVPWAQIAVRVVGSWIAAVGILVLALR